MLPNHDTIEKMILHWHGQADQAYVPATQMRVERRFSELNFSPPGMPPNMVLFIRSLRSLQPLSSLDFIPQHWEADIRQQVTDYYRQALHPVNRLIPPTAESVIFTDYAEVLAALTPAVIAGRWWNEWPWLEIIPMMQPGAALSTAWIKYVQYLPAAFSLLTPSQIQASVHLLTPAAINRVIQELRSTFNLPQITPSTAQADASSLESTGTQSSDQTALEPPWTNWLPPSLSSSTMSPQENYLVGLVIGLHRAPAYVRSQLFTTQTARWLSTQPNHQPTEQPRRVIITTRFGDEESTPTPSTQSVVAAGEALSEKRTEVSKADLTAKADIASDEPAIISEESALALPDETIHSPVIQDGQWTYYGGILYLINLLGWLGMPQDWGDDITQHVSSWGLVDLLARALLPDDSLNPNDAIWSILAELDHRDPNALIAPDFPQQSGFRLPANMIRRFDSTQPHWRAVVVENRLRLLDDTHLYLIAEQPLGGREPLTVIEDILTEYAGQGIQAVYSFGDDYPDETLSPFAAQICNPALQRWLQQTIGFVRYWLRSIADIEPQEMLQVLGRILTTFTHVDLYMSMESIDIRVRKVGLDLNPGWMPDFGYIILFHFEE